MISSSFPAPHQEAVAPVLKPPVDGEPLDRPFQLALSFPSPPEPPPQAASAAISARVAGSRPEIDHHALSLGMGEN